MANRKITDLPELTTVADSDYLAIVDASDTTESAEGTSKKISKANLLTGIGSNTEVLILDTSREIFNSTVGTLVIVKTYTIPANTFKDGAIIELDLKIDRLIGATANPNLTLVTNANAGQVDNQKFVNNVNALTATRRIVMRDVNYYVMNSSGSFPDDQDSPAQNTNYTELSIDRTVDTTLELQITFNNGGDEFRLGHLFMRQTTI